MKNNAQLKKAVIKNHTCYYFDDIIDNNGLDLDNIFIDKRHMEIF